MKAGIAGTTVLTSAWVLFAGDVKLTDKVFLSAGNTITAIQVSTSGADKYLVFRFKNRLDGRLSKGKGYFEKSTYGDSASTYCYKRLADVSDFEKNLLAEWAKAAKPVSVQYSCGEMTEDDKRKTFPGFAETNCQCLDFTFENNERASTPWKF